jgi:hypothetical protein
MTFSFLHLVRGFGTSIRAIGARGIIDERGELALAAPRAWYREYSAIAYRVQEETCIVLHAPSALE